MKKNEKLQKWAFFEASETFDEICYRELIKLPEFN
jgi:hypothetical protein